jgi:DNA-binding transcriptional ArsR family regulator
LSSSGRFYLVWSYRVIYIVEYVVLDMDDKSVLLSLGDDRMKVLAEVLGNKSCVRILDLLADSDLAVSDISKKLKMPINTVDYNVKKLVRSGLIEKASHWWSVKGKKMPVYRVSDRRIVISPRRSLGHKFLWTLGLTGLAAFVIRGLGSGFNKVGKNVIAEDGAFLAMPAVEGMEAMAVNAGATDAVLGAAFEVSFWASLSPWTWFLFGAWFAIALFFIFSIVSERRSKYYEKG